MQRFQLIARALREGPVSARKLAVRLETSEKTVQRDLTFMRDRLGLPIERDHRGSWLSRKVKLCACCGRALGS